MSSIFKKFKPICRKCDSSKVEFGWMNDVIYLTCLECGEEEVIDLR